MIIKALVFYIIFSLCIYIVGSGFILCVNSKDSLADKIKDSLLSRLASGLSLLLGVAMLTGFACGLIKTSFLIQMILVLLFVIAMFVLWIVKGRSKKATNPNTKDAGKRETNKDFSKKNILITLIFGILLLIQIVALMLFESRSGGNIHRLFIATSVFETGKVTGLDGLMAFWGGISKILGLHPMNLVFTILPLIIIPLYYSVYYLLLGRLLKNNFFYIMEGLIAISLLNIWGYQSVWMVPATMLLSYGLCECFIIHVILPFVLECILAFDLIKERDKESSTEDSLEENDEFYQEEWDMKKHKIVNARNLAIALGIVSIALIAFVFILNNKINTLHAATANLQEDLSKRCSIYEFKSEAGQVEGYLIKGSDGKLTMIGGGKEENAENLADFIVKNGGSVNNWYLYDTDAEEMGAYAKCVLEKGIDVDNVYILNRTQIEGIK